MESSDIYFAFIFIHHNFFQVNHFVKKKSIVTVIFSLGIITTIFGIYFTFLQTQSSISIHVGFRQFWAIIKLSAMEKYCENLKILFSVLLSKCISMKSWFHSVDIVLLLSMFHIILCNRFSILCSFQKHTRLLTTMYLYLIDAQSMYLEIIPSFSWTYMLYSCQNYAFVELSDFNIVWILRILSSFSSSHSP